MNDNMQEIATAFSERLGDSVDASEIRIYRGWLFWRRPEYPDEVECYHLPIGMIAEAWADISVADSPFSGEMSDEVIAKLNAGYDSYLDGE